MMDDRSLMLRAISLAERGRFEVCPNPCVGAVLVKDAKIIGEGWHKKFGGPHAEIECLQDAAGRGEKVEGACMYVTLEPCVHHGKTPPCADALIQAGIKKLVYGARDPNPEACGGADKLKEAGLEVRGPVCEVECRDLIADFIVWQKGERPYILLKLATTLDGRIATRNGHSRWISSEGSRMEVHKLRSGVGACKGAILIGGGTFRADDPELSARLENHACGRQPLACILTSRLPKKTDDFRLLRERPEQAVFFASPAASASTTAESLRQLGCRVFAIGQTADGVPDFSLMFKIMRKELDCLNVMCEGGSRLAMSLLEANLIDEFHLHIAPMILGDNDAVPLFSGRSPLGLEDALCMRFCKAAISDGDAHLLLRPKAGGG